MADSDILSAIHSKLTGYTLGAASDAYFAKVFKGPSEGLAPINKLASWEYVRSQDPPQGSKTFGNTMRQDVFKITCYWQRTPLEEGREDFESDLYTVSHELPGEFWADCQLGGYVTDLDIPESSKRVSLERYPDIDGPYWRTFTFDLLILVLEGEAIAA